MTVLVEYEDDRYVTTHMVHNITAVPYLLDTSLKTCTNRWDLVETNTLVARWVRAKGHQPFLIHRISGYTQSPTPSIYLAGALRDLSVTILAGQLRSAGFTITSTWHDATNPTTKGGGKSQRQALAAINYEGLNKAEVLIAVADPTSHLRGAHTEIGYMIGRNPNKPVVLYGPPNSFNMMTEHPNTITLPLP